MQQVQTLVLTTFTMLVAAPIMAVGGIIMAMREGLVLSWLLLVSVPVLVFAVGFIVSRMIPGFRRVQQRTDDINRVSCESRSPASVSCARSSASAARRRASPPPTTS